MPAFNFQARFADLVADRIKRQTIRAYRKDGRDPKIGDKLIFYTGQRTRQSRKLGIGRCRDCRPIRVDAACIELDGRVLSRRECNDFARADGFADFADLIAWCQERPGTLPFFGLVYYW